MGAGQKEQPRPEQHRESSVQSQDEGRIGKMVLLNSQVAISLKSLLLHPRWAGTPTETVCKDPGPLSGP